MSVNTPIDQDEPEIPAGGEGVDTAVIDSASAGADKGDAASDATSKADDGPKSMLEAVMQSFETPGEAGVKADSEGDKPAPSEHEDKSDTAGEPDEAASPAEVAAKEVGDPDYVPPEEWRQFGPKARKRIDRLRKNNRELKSEVEESRPIVETVRRFGFTQEDTDISFGLMAALRKGDFKTFVDGITPYYELAQEALGVRLPQDLQRQVDDGFTTPEIASELARTRFKAEQAEAQVETHRETAATQTDERTAGMIRSTVAEWESQVKLRDPDYARKEGLIHREAARLVEKHGVPRNQREALALAKKAYDEATEIAKSVGTPSRQATRPAPNGSARSTGNLRAEPRTMLEAIEQGLARS